MAETDILAPTQHPKPTFQPSIDTIKLIERLRNTNVGDEIAYQELDALVGRDVRNGAQGSFRSARRNVEKNHQIVFGTLRGIGIVRLSDTDIVKSGQDALGRVRRAARRAYKRTACVNFDKLDEATKVQHQAYQTLFNALAVVSARKALTQIEDKVSQTRATLSLAATLEAFK